MIFILDNLELSKVMANLMLFSMFKWYEMSILGLLYNLTAILSVRIIKL